MHQRFRSMLARAGDPPRVSVLDERGDVDSFGMTMAAGCVDADLQACEAALEYALPASYVEFLRISDGAVLFLDLEYGQWGARLHGTRSRSDVSDLLTARDEYRHSADQLPMANRFLPFCSWLGDGDLLGFDLGWAPERSGRDELRVVMLPADLPPADAFVVAPNFELWLDRLVACGGEKWWEWFPSVLNV